MTVRDTLMASAGTGGVNYWVNALSESGIGDTILGIDVDASGNIYVVGTRQPIVAEAFVIKLNSSGSIVWQKTLVGNSTQAAFYNVKVDSIGNVYVCGTLLESGPGYGFLIAKYNSSGVEQWVKTINLTYVDTAFDIDFDASGNVYVIGGITQYPGYNDVLLTKYNTSGVLQWQKTYGDGQSQSASALKLDSSGNIYYCGEKHTFGSSNYISYLNKCDSSGNLVWQKSLNSSYTEYGTGVGVDSSNNVYVCGYTFNGSANTSFFAKYDTSGNLTWQRSITSIITEALYVDSSDNIYLVGQLTGTNNGCVIKYNSSGQLQWQRKLEASPSTTFAEVKVDGNGNVFACGSKGSGSSQTGLILKIPSNGTRTGTYGSYTYTGSSLTDSAGSLTDGTPSMTATTSSYTSATPYYVSGTGALTRTITYL